MYKKAPIFITLLVSLFFIPLVVGAQTKTTSGLVPCGNVSSGGAVVASERCDFNDIIILAKNVIEFLIFRIAAPLGAVMFAYAGFLYVTNGGNESKVKQAHEIFTYVFIGLVVALSAWLVVKFILDFFLGSGTVFNLIN